MWFSHPHGFQKGSADNTLHYYNGCIAVPRHRSIYFILRIMLLYDGAGVNGRIFSNKNSAVFSGNQQKNI